jgi:hypothetical protein
VQLLTAKQGTDTSASVPASRKFAHCGQRIHVGTQPSVKLYDNGLFSNERQQGAVIAEPSRQREQQQPMPRRYAAPRHSTGSLPGSRTPPQSDASGWHSPRMQPRHSQLSLTGGGTFAAGLASSNSMPEPGDGQHSTSPASDGLPPRPMSPGRVLGSIAPAATEQRRPRSSAGPPPETSSAPSSRPDTPAGRMQLQIARQHQRRSDRLQVKLIRCRNRQRAAALCQAHVCQLQHRATTVRHNADFLVH